MTAPEFDKLFSLDPFDYPQEVKFSQRMFDLQLFADDDKTEDPTEKRKSDALKEGNIAKSQDLAAVVCLLTAVITLKNYGPDMCNTMTLYMKKIMSFFITGSAAELGAAQSIRLMTHCFLAILKSLVPILSAIAVGGVAINLYQTGFNISFAPFEPKIDRFNPINGIKNLFTMKNAAELIKSILKIIIVIYIPYSTIKEQFPLYAKLVMLPPPRSFAILGDLMYEMAIKILLVLLALAAADYKFQLWRHNEDLKMSTHDIKEEYKQQEGDPQVKQKIKEKQRQASTRKQMDEVPKATVVVTNPTHIAVAVKYDMNQKEGAPTIVAMGSGLIAQKIKEIAAANDVPIVENKPFARALHKSCKVGDEIPSELWEVMAEILTQVYRQRAQAA